MIGSKVRTIKDGISMMSWGADFRSKKILLCIDLLNHLGHGRKKLRTKIAAYIERKATNGDLYISLTTNAHKKIHIKIRANDYSDYQSLSECLGSMYEIEAADTEFLIDAGANVGFFAISMLKKSRVKEAIIIEPNPRNLNYLRYNLKEFTMLKICPYAISNKEGNVIFELATSNTGHLKGAIGHDVTPDHVEVACRKLSSLIPTNWDMKKTMLKIDIEGAEYDVIPEIFDNNIFPAIITGEIHDYLQSNGENLISLISKNGYNTTVTGFGNTGNVCRQFTAVKRNS